ncbi:MAG: trypsin-like peptidase domain-containing protein [Bacteroidota bacterium]
MKHIISLVFAGIIGGLITLGGVYLMKSDQQHLQTSPAIAQQINQSLVNTSRSTAVPTNFTDAAQRAMPAVVHITASESAAMAQKRRQDSNDPLRNFFGDDFFFGNPFSPDRGGKRGTGSGVIISKDGYIVTNNHVVGFADEVEVTTYDNRTFKAQIIGTDPETDLAVLKIEEDNLPTLSYGDSDLAQVGEWVLAVGNPFDLTSTVTAGIISAKGRDINIIQGNRSIEAFIQTDAAVNPGNSGGALVDTRGNLIGINTAIATQTGSFSGYSFAIPVNIMSKIVDDIIEYGSYQRAFLGINITAMDSELADELGLVKAQGVYVSGLAEGGAAAYAGVLPKDVIVAVDGNEIKSVPELQEFVGRAKVGDTLTLTVRRKGKTKKIPVKLKAG